MSATIITTTSQHRRIGWAIRITHVVLWVLQVLLAVVFVLHGWMLIAPPADLMDVINAQLGVGFRLFLGVAELLAAIGLILPGVTRILPFLTTWAAAGVMVVMVSATVFHVFRGESASAVITALLLLMATAVAVLRSEVAPIPPRNHD